MQYMILVAVAGWAWAGAGVGEAAVTCENVATCTPDMHHLSTGDHENKADLHQACVSIRAAMQCFREAMTDCRSNSAIPEATLTQLESQMTQYDDMLDGHCGPSASSSAQGDDAQYTGTDENEDDSASNSSGGLLSTCSAATLLSCLLVLFL